MRRASLVMLLALASTAASAASVELVNAWMRPAAAGADAARAYVDIRSDASVELVGASTPVARDVLIVHVGTIGDESTEKVEKSYAVAGGTTTRLAYRGDHLRLVGMKRDVANGDYVPVTLVFEDANGRRFESTARVTVRGLLLPQAIPEEARDAPHPPK